MATASTRRQERRPMARQRRRLFAALIVAVSTVVSTRMAAQATADSAARDGQRDFDFNIGRWRTQLRVLEAPLTGSTKWIEFEGTSVVTSLLGGDANIVELDVTGASGRIEGVLLRLYDREARQWTMHFANRRSGRLTPPLIGEFRDGRGEFFAHEVVNGRTVLVRFVISGISRDSATFEQSYSADGGRTWEVNWHAVDTRIPD